MKNIVTCLLLILLPINGFAADTTAGAEVSQELHNLSSEAADLISAPWQIKNGNLLLTLGVFGATSLTYAFDGEIQERISSNSSKGLDNITDAGSLVGNPLIHLGMAGLVYGAGIAAESPRWKSTGQMLGEALILADASSFIIKEAVGRGRPLVTERKGDLKPFRFTSDYDSFPSMHTASSFAAASILSATSNSFALSALYYSAASFVGFSRMYQNKHWASDVLFGAVLGELCGRIVTNYHVSGRNWVLTPIAYESGAGLNMVKLW